MRQLIESLPESLQSLITLLLLLGVAFLHFISPPTLAITPVFGADKIAHCLIFFSVTSWSCVVYSRNRIRQFAFFLILYGLSLELMQMTIIPDRNFEWMDWFSDISGIHLGLFTISKRL